MSKEPAAHMAVGSESDTALLQAALDLAGELALDGAVRKLRGPLSAVSGAVRGGFVLYEEEWRLLRAFLTELPAAGSAPSDVTCFDRPSSADPLAELNGEEFPTLISAATAAGWLGPSAIGDGRVVALVPLEFNGRRFGALFVVFRHESQIAVAGREQLRRLATLVIPVLWNCLSQERFSRGDRRRDALVTLNHSINQSLKFDAVLAAAQAVLRQLTDESYSAVELLEKDGYRTLVTPPSSVPNETPVTLQPLPGSVLAWLLAHPGTLESPDLADERRFAGDEERAAAGVRRYLATPLRARGRLLGALVVGWSTPHPARQIDIWLYENIGLQVALALENARQHEQMQQLSVRLSQQNVYLREEIQREHDFSEMVGRAPAMREVVASIGRVGPTDAIVLIAGETGVGKELVARAVHAASPRANQPMVKVNCAAIPEGTVESELFGHERGAFTSAVERRVGRFELAADGTLFLDEVGELPLAVQAKLLRVLQDGEFERVGGSKTLHSNARIIAATNRNLLAEVEAGRFRRDLYYRLSVFPIQVPPLRDRREDIPLLVEAFVAQFGRRMGRRVEALDRGSLERLCQRDWPGNIRELRHVVERAMILCDGPRLVFAPEGAASGSAAREVARDSPPNVLRTLDEVEAEHIRQVLAYTRGVIEGSRGAALILNMTPSTLRYQMKRLGVARPAPGDAHH